MRKPLDIRKIHSFTEIARHGSFRLAALAMGVSQPALTRQILALEEELGVVLLERGGRTTKMTEAGVVLFERSEALLVELYETRALVKSLGAEPTGPVNLALLTSFSASFSIHLLKRSAERLPDVRLRITEGTSHYVEQRLLSGGAEIGVMLDGAISSKLVGEPIIVEDFQLFGSRFPVSRAAWSFKDIAELPLVLPPPPHGTRRLIDEAAQREGIKLVPFCEVDSPYLIRELMLSGGVFAILPDTAVAPERQSGQLKAVQIQAPPTRSVVIGTLRGEPLSPAARALATEIRRVVHDIQGGTVADII